MRQPLGGVYVALTTPFINDEISTEEMAQNIHRLEPTPLSGYLVLGSTGESVYLTDEESIRLVETVVRTASPGKRILVGTARESTKATLAFTNRMAAYGIAAALVRPPAYFKSRMTREALRGHFLALAEAAAIPILVYNIPQNTGIILDPDLVAELARHPNIIGLKESSGSLAYLGELLPRVPDEFLYFLGSGHVLYPGLEMGADGAILAVANAAPEMCTSIYRLFGEGRKDEARNLQLELIPLNKAVIETYGIPGLKYAQDLRGFYGGPARSPLRPMDERGKKELEELLRKMGMVS